MLGNENLVNPYLQWAVATKFRYFNGEWFRVLLEVDKSAASFWRDVQALGVKHLIQVPTIYQKPPSGLNETDVTFCMAIMKRTALEALVTETPKDDAALLQSLAKRITKIELGTPVKKPFEITPPAELSSLAAKKPSAAIVAVIDDGLAFAHERFRSKDGRHTRFKYFWNQDDFSGVGQTGPLGFGRELTEQDINGLLAKYRHSSVVDEDALYREAGQVLTARRAKHGTHIMDVACGLDPQDVKADSPYLIGVQLSQFVTTETSGVSLTPAALAGIDYVLNRADQIASDEGTAQLPIVINLSYGIIAGPHDGSAPLEAKIDELIAARQTPLRVVLPAGNHLLARCHSKFDLAEAASTNSTVEVLRWRIQPDDKAASMMEIWLPELATDQTRPQVEVRLTTPTGEATQWVQPGQQWPPQSYTGPVRYFVTSLDPPNGRPWILLSVIPTADMTTNPLTAPSGTWLVEIRNKAGAISVDAWVQRGDTPFGYPLWGRQSRFDDSNYKRFDLAGRLEEEDASSSYIRRAGTINALATGHRAIVIGGFRRSDYDPSCYSGAGPVATPAIVPPPRHGPDAAAVADDSVALHGVLAAGTRTGSVVAMTGTSVAAPQITRRIAKWMTTGLMTDRAAVQYFAAANDPAPLPSRPAPERIGAGRIERPPRVKVRWKRW
jgi:hypothetical protein